MSKKATKKHKKTYNGKTRRQKRSRLHYRSGKHPRYTYNLKENELLDKELELVEEQVDKLSENTKKQEVNSPLIKKMITVVEDFLRENELICYGGTAINNILPLEDQFYDYHKEIPDYDFFSKNALNDAKRLADIYTQHGFNEVEAKSGIHTGTYKVYVNFIPIADITQMDKVVFKLLKQQSMDVFGIAYASPDYLRMSMYLELSRPRGDVSRWVKVAKRLGLLNKSFPMKTSAKCYEMDFSKAIQCKTKKVCQREDDIRTLTLKHLIGLGVVFFGGYASSLYAEYMDNHKEKQLEIIPYYDVISTDAYRDAMLLKAKLEYDGYDTVSITPHKAIGENVSEHYEVIVDKKSIAYIYKALACHNYNTLRINDNNVNIATIDTMLNLYLAFLYSDHDHLNNDRIVCLANYMFELHQKHRLNKKGLFKRFNLPCIGYQETIMDIRRTKSEKYESLKRSKDLKEFERYFLRYVPSEMKRKIIPKRKNNKTVKKGKKMSK